MTVPQDGGGPTQGGATAVCFDAYVEHPVPSDSPINQFCVLVQPAWTGRRASRFPFSARCASPTLAEQRRALVTSAEDGPSL